MRLLGVDGKYDAKQDSQFKTATSQSNRTIVKHESQLITPKPILSQIGLPTHPSGTPAVHVDNSWIHGQCSRQSTTYFPHALNIPPNRLLHFESFLKATPRGAAPSEAPAMTSDEAPFTNALSILLPFAMTGDARNTPRTTRVPKSCPLSRLRATGHSSRESHIFPRKAGASIRGRNCRRQTPPVPFWSLLLRPRFAAVAVATGNRLGADAGLCVNNPKSLVVGNRGRTQSGKSTNCPRFRSLGGSPDHVPEFQYCDLLAAIKVQGAGSRSLNVRRG
jgi:hypothetical protein